VQWKPGGGKAATLEEAAYRGALGLSEWHRLRGPECCSALIETACKSEVQQLTATNSNQKPCEWGLCALEVSGVRVGSSRHETLGWKEKDEDSRFNAVCTICSSLH
jgi:hypothetical protein